MTAVTQPAPAVPASVLVVDDDARVRRGLRALIESSASLSVAGEARSRSVALRVDEEVVPDVVLLDLLIPSPEDGLAVLECLIARGRVIVAVSIRDAMRDVALRRGAVAFVSKGAGPDAILDALHRVAGGSRLGG